MALFRNKCENEEYLQMNCFIDFIEGLLKKDEFISKSMYMNQYQEITPLFNEFISLSVPIQTPPIPVIYMVLV